MKRILCLAILATGLVGAAHAVNFTLTDGNAVVNGDTNNQLTDWLTDGIDNLWNQDYYWRVGNTTGEANLGAIGAPVVNQVSANSVQVIYTHALFRADITYTLIGGAPGSGTSDIGEIVRIQNISNSALDFHLFEYDDFDINGTSGGDTAFYDGLMHQSEAGITALVGTVPLNNHWQIGTWPSILNSLTDTNPTTLSDSGSPTGPADCSFALQWDRTINVGGTWLMSKNKHIETVPEPATMTALGLGIAAMVRRRAKK